MSDIASFFGPDDQKRVANAIKSAYPSFNEARFLKTITPGIMDIPLKERMRKTTHAVNDHLPAANKGGLDILCHTAPALDGLFAAMFIPDYVEVFCREDFHTAMDALGEITKYGSSEFAVRPFYEQDPDSAIKYFHRWAEDDNKHVRRLASEGLRPRLPWSFQIKSLMRDPSPAFGVLEKLMADNSEYVRRSVANHINDITKDNPDAALDFLNSQDMSNDDNIKIARHALRSLIKAAHPEAFRFLGFEAVPKIKLSGFDLRPATCEMGDDVVFHFTLTSTSDKPQKLAIDYVMHFMKKNGQQNEKVFKLSECVLAPYETRAFSKKQTMKSHSTRTLYPGRHDVDVMINGTRLAGARFELFASPHS